MADAVIINLMWLGQNANMYARTKYAMQKAAIDVMAELATVTGHTLRIAYAQKILTGQASVQEVLTGLLTNGTIAAAANPSLEPHFNIPDGDIQFVVNSLFDAFSGVAN